MSTDATTSILERLSNSLRSLESLPDDPATLKAMIGELLTSLQVERRAREGLEQRIDILLNRLYGKKSEKIDPNQLLLFPDALETPEVPAEESAASDQPASEAPKDRCRNGKGRRKLPGNLPRVRIEHDLAEAEKICPCCGDRLTSIGEQTSEQLDYKPASLFVWLHVRKTYACKGCQGHVTTAPKPAEPIDKGLPGPGLLAHVTTSKYSDHLPLYRQESILARHGVSISRKTMCDWMAKVAQLVKPIARRMRTLVLQSKVIHTDDTPVPVLDPSRPGKTKTGRLWVYLGDADHPYTLFDFTPDHSRDGPRRWFGDYKGYVQADGFNGYDEMFRLGHVKEVACWAHARRKFFEAKSSDASRSHQMLAMVGQLYAVERAAKVAVEDARRDRGDLSQAQADAIILSLRREKSAPMLARIGTWLEEHARRALPKSPIGQAIAYARSNWDALCRYTQEGYLAIDNNAAERAVKNVVIGRKNYLHFGSDNGGDTAAVLYSITVTCKRLGIDPFAYLRDVLAAVSTHPAKAIDELLPDRWAARVPTVSDAPPDQIESSP